METQAENWPSCNTFVFGKTDIQACEEVGCEACEGRCLSD